ncbi:MAG TPA: hypothetical protein VFQ51_11570 [Vicinamibacteria bacterium]|nr:hypothetical protein [Vicinamibacteria bacterium]
MKAIFLLAVSVAGIASADEIYLKSGGQLSGRIVSRTAGTIEIEVGAGRMKVPASTVARIEEGRSPLQEYEERAANLAPGDAPGWLALGDWASARALGTQARQAYERALSASPDNAKANEALGRVQVGGRWLSEEEGYRAKGYVEFEGEWMTPQEQQSIQAERAASDQASRARREADARVREAEERAHEAEARAKEAEAAAQEANEGLPLWYGWGAGPVVWPTGPIVRPTPPRPAQRPSR